MTLPERQRRRVALTLNMPGIMLKYGNPPGIWSNPLNSMPFVGILPKQKEFMGKMRTPEEWKLLLISAHKQATGGRADVVAGLEGEWVNSGNQRLG